MRAVIAAHLGTRQVSRVLYGSIIGLALVVALEAHPPSAGVITVTLLLTAVAVGLAELYSEVVGEETRTHARFGREQLIEVLDDIAAVALGVAFPALFFALAALGLPGMATFVGEFLILSGSFVVAPWATVVAASGFVIAVVYALGPRRTARPKDRSLRSVLPGAAVGTALWFAVSLLFTAYVSHFGSYDKTYGTLGGVIVFLLWLWITNMAILLGAEFNAETERARQLTTGTRDAERTLGLPEREAPSEKQLPKTA